MPMTARIPLAILLDLLAIITHTAAAAAVRINKSLSNTARQHFLLQVLQDGRLATGTIRAALVFILAKNGTVAQLHLQALII